MNKSGLLLEERVLKRLHRGQSTRAVSGEATTHEVDGVVKLRALVLAADLLELVGPELRVESAYDLVQVVVGR